MSVRPGSNESHRRVTAAWLIVQLATSLLCLAFSILRLSQEGGTVILRPSWPWLATTLPMPIAGAASLALLLRRGRPSPVEKIAGRLRQPKTRHRGLVLALGLIMTGMTILVIETMAAAPAISPHLRRLVPLAGWLALSGLSLAVAIIGVASGDGRRDLLGFVLALSILSLGLAVHARLWPAVESSTNDIYYTYEEGGRLLRGENPYLRILEGDMRQNQKYATYLPLFYYFSALVQSAGFGAFPQWIAVLRIIFLLANLSIAATLFYAAHQRGHTALGVFSSLFWAFNRWTLHVAFTGDVDFLPLSLLLASILLAHARPRTSLLLFGISTAIKHYSLFLAPILLMTTWKNRPSARRIAVDLLVLGSVPLVAALPFLLSNTEALVRSLLFTATRNAAALGDLASMDARLGWQGAAARLPMLVLLLLIYAAAWRERLGALMASLLIMATVTFFNPVFFASYMVWVIPFLPLAVLAALPGSAEIAP